MPYVIESACMCSIGKVRKNNEDNFFFNGSGLEENNVALISPITMSRSSSKSFSVSVFDGMGGENFGECASYAATRRMQEKTLTLGENYIPDSKSLEGLCLDINMAVVEKQRELCTERMGSTLVSLCFSGARVYASNLGDSRAYRYREGELLQLSEDHVEHRPGHKKAPLTQHLGIDPAEYRIEPHVVADSLKTGDLYLICSDGVTDMLEDDEIKAVLSSFSSCEECVGRLVDAALEKGGIDNTTAILCRVASKEAGRDPAPEGELAVSVGENGQSAKLNKIAIISAAVLAVAVLASALIISKVALPSKRYVAAVNLLLNNNYEDAESAFEALGDYKDAPEKVQLCKETAKQSHFSKALELMVAGDYEEAIAAFESLGDYKDAPNFIDACREAICAGEYSTALELMAGGQYEEAIAAFESLEGYKDAVAKIAACEEALTDKEYEEAVALLAAEKYEEAEAAFTALGDYKDSQTLVECCRRPLMDTRYESALELMSMGKYLEAVEILANLGDYKDSAAKMEFCNIQINNKEIYEEAVSLMNKEEYETALEKLSLLTDYENTEELIETCREKIAEIEKQSAIPRDIAALMDGIQNPEVSEWLSERKAAVVKLKSGKTAYLLKQADSSSEQICVLEDGQTVDVLAESKDYSLVKTSDGKLGWVYKSFIKTPTPFF